MDLSWVDSLPEDLRQVLLGKAEEALAKNALADYKPYAKQRVFHRAGADLSIRERLLKAGNQLGKCVTGRSLVDTVTGPVRADALRAGDVVYAWDGERKVESRIVEPFKKAGLHDCALIVMSDGRWIEAADHHRVLTSSGWHLVSDLLPPSFFCRPRSNWACGLSARAAGVRRWIETLAGSLGRCSAGLHQCGGPLREALETGPATARQRCDVLQRSGHSARSGASASTQSGSPLSGQRRPASLDGLRQSAGRVAGWLAQAAYSCAGPSPLRRLAAPLLRGAASIVLRSVGAVALPELLAGPAKTEAWETPEVDGNRIIAVIPIGRHEVYDFTVPGLHNYCAAGLVNHNTWSAGFETAMHLTGRYPDWWDGAVFDGPVSGWAAGVTGEVTRDSVQRVLCGRKNAMGTGAIPADAIKARTLKRGVADAIDTVVVKWGGGGDVQAKESLLGFKSYDQGREKFQAETLDFVWLDEEPDDLEIYTEALTRTNATQGIVYMTFTPLKGMTDVVKRFLIDKVTGTHVTNMTIHDAEHYTPEQRIQIINSYPAHEREARANGTPMLGSGRIFPIAEDVLMERAPSIPYHWKRIAGIDFGWDHATATVWIGYDADTDVAHVYDCYRVKEATPIIHAAAIRARGEWIPVAWPHDGLQHDKGSGETLANQYRKQNVNMLKDKATHAPNTDNGEKEGEGGNGVEAGLMDMLDRMQTGRLKVAKHLEDWWEEFRLYHRKDGKIVKENDDLMSATRYALMMLRHAKTNQAEAPRRRLMSPDVGTVAGMGPLG